MGSQSHVVMLTHYVYPSLQKHRVF